jgi:hypothetical protein
MYVRYTRLKPFEVFVPSGRHLGFAVSDGEEGLLVRLEMETIRRGRYSDLEKTQSFFEVSEVCRVASWDVGVKAACPSAA